MRQCRRSGHPPMHTLVKTTSPAAAPLQAPVVVPSHGFAPHTSPHAACVSCCPAEADKQQGGAEGEPAARDRANATQARPWGRSAWPRADFATCFSLASSKTCRLLDASVDRRPPAHSRRAWPAACAAALMS